MKKFLKIIESTWVQGSNTKMIHKNKNGELYLGPRIDASKNDTVIVESSDGKMDDGYYHIIKVVDIIYSKK